MAIVITLLYPVGSKLLNMVRDRYHSTVYGKEVIYSNIENGDIRVADKVLENKYEISRFAPVTIAKLTWKENPFDDIYWRFNYYNFEPVRNLLFAWVKTGNPKYKNKLIEITESFIDNGTKGPYSWDYHGAAFRVMTLIDVREKLYAKNELSPDLDKKILAILKIHGDFLADTTHFEDDFNHGLDQSAALYLLAVNFPKMNGADGWLKLSSKRIVEMQANIIDADGVLIENSPYYHFYVLEKFLEINKYLKQNHLTIDGFSDEKINKMISYAVYILQPDLSVPTIGASIGRQINLFGLYKEIAGAHPELLYVLTQGTDGIKPTNLNIQYPVSGQTIMRSGWGKKKNFLNQTQLIFDVGNYRTNHSDLDALSFNLFGAGITLMPDAGLYTYEAGPYRSYFHGTRSHNTVVVDGKDQETGGDFATQPKKVFPGFFQEGDGYVYQSGEHFLYDGVSHERAIVMIENSTILILDNLKSSSTHTYEQMFHLFLGAKITSNGLTLKAEGSESKQSLIIKQFITDGLELHTTIDKQKPLDGLCSVQYKVAIPCYVVSYAQKGKNVSYVTAISIGQNTADVKFDRDSNLLTIKTKKREYSVKINETENVERSIEVNKKNNLSQVSSLLQPADSLNMLNKWQIVYTATKVSSPVVIDSKENSMEIITPLDGSSVEVVKNINLDLSNQNIYFKIKTDKIFNLNDLSLYFSNDNWVKYAKITIQNVIYYPNINRDSEWIEFGVAKSDLRKVNLGGWKKNDPTFDWSKIDSVKLIVRSKQGLIATVDIKDFSLVPDEKEARAVIVFDDGWASVLDAAKVMKKNGIKGNIAVISGIVDKRNFLTLDNLKTLQNDYGWNMVSHSSLHKDAVQEYADNNNLKGLDIDVGDSLQYMIQNNINSAPNWYIYPNGSADDSIKQIIGKYFKFARATFPAPQLFPFAEPLEVGVLPVYSDRAEPLDIHNAISDAIKYKQTLFLMFHKISKGTPSIYTEWSLNDFSTVVKDMKEQGIKVVTLSELDKKNGIPESKIVLHEVVPSQFVLDISVNRESNKILNTILNVWK